MTRRTLYTVPEFPKEVREEFRREAKRRGVNFLHEIGEFFIADENGPDLAWATDISWQSFEVPIPSIAQGGKNLREATKLVSSPRSELPWKWMRLEGLHHRRAALIAGNLHFAEAPPLSFLRGSTPAPRRNIAGFFLISPDIALAVFDSLTPYPGGQVHLSEQKVGPPSRAYLKLWEICARIEHAGGRRPNPEECALDLGSCPGGWTWALAEMGTEVFSMDGAPLDPEVMKRPEVIFKKGDAFQLRPEDALGALHSRKKIDWLFSDMICEPKRLPELISRWQTAENSPRFALSVKFKGEADLTAIDELRAIPGGRLRHLRQNKHELTWFHIPEAARL